MEKSDLSTMVRRGDPTTSRSAAIHAQERTPTHKMLLLKAYYDNPDGLTDEEAGIVTGLINKPKCSYWKRCGELEADGFVARTLFTREGMTGNLMIVRAITDLGRKQMEKK